MDKKTITEKITEYLRANRRRWIAKWKLEEQHECFGCLAETIDRKMRLLASKSEHVEIAYKNRIVHYRWI